MLIINEECLKAYKKENRLWQGIPTIERTKCGRLFASFYSGGKGEGPGNYVLLKKSDDNGETWSDIIAVIDPKLPARALDPCLWKDPDDRLWWFWNQFDNGDFDGIAGVRYVRCDNPDETNLSWTKPVRFANGIMMNKPTVLSNGDWLLPCAIWKDGSYKSMPKITGIANERFSNIYRSQDKGKSFSLLGSADVPDRHCDEHMVVELEDGRLLMLVRTHYGLGKSYSEDNGKTWTAGADSGLGGPSSRFFIRRLKSGRILLINHYKYEIRKDVNAQFPGRNNLCAMLSEDEGKSWKGFLMIDERDDVSYPDGTEDEQSNIYIIYDRERQKAREILMAKVTEEDILAGKIVSKESRLRMVVDKL